MTYPPPGAPGTPPPGSPPPHDARPPVPVPYAPGHGAGPPADQHRRHELPTGVARPPGSWPPDAPPPIARSMMAPAPGGFPPPPGVNPSARAPHDNPWQNAHGTTAPRRNAPVVAAIVFGVLAVAAAFTLVAVMMPGQHRGTDPVASGPTASAGTTRSAPQVPPPDAPADASQADLAGIRSSMQSFVDAFNTRDVTRIRTAVCSTVRAQVTSPPSGAGNLVLEDLMAVSVSGDFAQSQVVTHLESGALRSTSKTNPESFVREGGTWYFCPGSRPDMGT